jgi:dipeptidyl aminopeptidase/acylaminoacyl peptidase
MKKDFVIETSDKNFIRISTFENHKFPPKPCIIYVHGFKGFKDWGFVPYLAEYFSQKGFFVITFNFSHNGVGKSQTEFDELEKFAKNTISREVEELSLVVNSYKNAIFTSKVSEKVGILGHSRGGGVSLLTGSQKNEVTAVAVWASISRFDRYSEEQIFTWKKNGFLEVLNSRTNQMMKLGIGLLNDIEANKHDKLNIEKAVRFLDKPLFIAHGDQDTSVPFHEAEEIYSWANKDLTTFFEIPATGHTFDVVHPFSGTNEKFDFLLKKTNSFFQKYLS